jgi:hypothetical protein
MSFNFTPNTTNKTTTPSFLNQNTINQPINAPANGSMTPFKNNNLAGGT